MAANEDQQTDVTDGEEGTMTSEYMNKLHNERMQRQRNLAETVLSHIQKNSTFTAVRRDVNFSKLIGM